MKNGLEIDEYGTKRYYKNDEYHREDGPAVEWTDGYKAWYFNGKLHREDGTAIEYVNGDKAWFLDDEEYFPKSNEEFLKMVKYKWLL